MMPDMTEEASIHLPGNNQQPLRAAVVRLHKDRPDLFAIGPRFATSKWDVVALLNLAGGEYLAGLIQTALDPRPHSLSGGDCVACGASKWLEGTPPLDQPCPVTPDQELSYLRFFHKAASSAFGPADDDIYRLIADNYRDQFGDPPLGYDRDRLNRLEVGEDED